MMLGGSSDTDTVWPIVPRQETAKSATRHIPHFRCLELAGIFASISPASTINGSRFMLSFNTTHPVDALEAQHVIELCSAQDNSHSPVSSRMRHSKAARRLLARKRQSISIGPERVVPFTQPPAKVSTGGIGEKVILEIASIQNAVDQLKPNPRTLFHSNRHGPIQLNDRRRLDAGEEHRKVHRSVPSP